MNTLFFLDITISLFRARVIIVLILLTFITDMFCPQVARAEELSVVDTLPKAEAIIKSGEKTDLLEQRQIEFKENPPEEASPVIVKTMAVIATAYSSDVYQTDSTPCITANGFNVCKHGEENVLAANFLKFGTKVRIPEIYGNKIFSVQDRMNKRYYYRIDLWKTSRNKAISFGRRLVKIEVLE